MLTGIWGWWDKNFPLLLMAKSVKASLANNLTFNSKAKNIYDVNQKFPFKYIDWRPTYIDKELFKNIHPNKSKIMQQPGYLSVKEING